MNKLKIIVKTAKSNKTGHEFFKYSTIKADGSYIDVKFNSKGVDLSKLPEKTFIIYVKPEDMNEKTKQRDGQPIVSEKTGKAIKELWIAAIDHFADQKEVDADNEAYKKARSAKVAEEYPQA